MRGVYGVLDVLKELRVAGALYGFDLSLPPHLLPALPLLGHQTSHSCGPSNSLQPVHMSSLKNIFRKRRARRIMTQVLPWKKIMTLERKW